MMRYISKKERFTIAMSIFPVFLWINAIITPLITGEWYPMNWLVALFITLCAFSIWIIVV